MSKTSNAKRGADSQKRVDIQRKPCNINDCGAALEAMQELRRMAQVRMAMDDNSDETWAMLMGAKALDRLAG